jgi:DNA modification methylase
MGERANMYLRLSTLPTPKQARGTLEGRAAWYGYYAGYSPLFVSYMLKRFSVPAGESILDPWNGVGTTTQVAQENGNYAIGFDLNPVAVVVAKARQLHCGVLPSIASLSREILQTAKDHQQDWVPALDPLSAWFTPAAAATLRGIEASIQHLLVSHDSYRRIVDLQSLKTVSDLGAFFYTALFRVVRELLAVFRTSNPTWIRQRVEKDERLAVSPRKIHSLFRASVEQMTPALEIRKIEPKTRSRLDLGSSAQLPLPNESVAAVITSPPYCTRIDYAVTTCPELALLGMDLSSELKRLRDRMMGTSTIANTPEKADVSWGPTCGALLDNIERHPSRAARSYYLKTYLQYFSALQMSIGEISRVLKRGGKAALVVQDSHFKELHVDLATMIADMGCHVKLLRTNRVDFPARRTMCAVHKHARRYRESLSATESVVVFSKQ